MHLQRRMEVAAKDFAIHRKEREREVLQLRRQVRLMTWLWVCEAVCYLACMSYCGQ